MKFAERLMRAGFFAAAMGTLETVRYLEEGYIFSCIGRGASAATVYGIVAYISENNPAVLGLLGFVSHLLESPSGALGHGIFTTMISAGTNYLVQMPEVQIQQQRQVPVRPVASQQALPDPKPILNTRFRSFLPVDDAISRPVPVRVTPEVTTPHSARPAALSPDNAIAPKPISNKKSSLDTTVLQRYASGSRLFNVRHTQRAKAVLSALNVLCDADRLELINTQIALMEGKKVNALFKGIDQKWTSQPIKNTSNLSKSAYYQAMKSLKDELTKQTNSMIIKK